MDNGLLILALVIPIAVVLIWLGKHTVRQKLAKGKIPLSFAEIYNSTRPNVSVGTLDRVFHALGKAYDINPQLIRPNDPLKHFFDLDSWRLDAGTEHINKWLATQGIKDSPAELATVLDLLLLVEGHQSEKEKEQGKGERQK